MRLVLLGLPAAGKGTQGKRISAEFSIPHISTGSIIRDAIESGTSLGRRAQEFISKGNLVPDDLVIQIVGERLSKSDCTHGWILDGFPRTVAQARHLDQELSRGNGGVDFVLDIRISGQEAVRRISQRRVCGECGSTFNVKGQAAGGRQVMCTVCGGELIRRADDTEEIARQRLRVYMAQTHPVLHYYALDGRLVSIDGERSIDEVFQDVYNVLLKCRCKPGAGEAR